MRNIFSFKNTPSQLLKIFIFALITLSYVIANYFGISIFADLENRTWDWRSKLSDSSNKIDNRIKIISIDQSTLDFLNDEYQLTWPFPRETYIYLIDFLKRSGAKGVAFDILFTESALLNLEGDLAFADASVQDFPIVHSYTLNKYSKPHSDDKIGVFNENPLKNINPNKQLLQKKLVPEEFNSLTLPFRELITNGSKLGFVNAIPDEDGVFRNHYSFASINEKLLLSLPLTFLLNTVTDEKSKEHLLERVLNSSNIVRVHSKESSYSNYSFASIIQSEASVRAGDFPLIPLHEFKDSWVFVGCTAPGLLDFRPTSNEKNGTGVSYVASAFDNMLNDSFVRTTSNNQKNVFVVAILGIAFLISMTNLSSYKKSISAITLAIIYFLIVVFAAFDNLWLPMVSPIFSIFLFSFTSLSVDYQFEGRRHRFLKKAFQQYLSPSLINEIVANPDRLSLGGEKKILTIIFSDIVGFTSLSEKINPDVLVDLLNEYLSLLTDIVLLRGGTVDKYVGDAIIAFWNAPVENNDHANCGLNCVLECYEKLEIFKGEFISKFGYFPATRFGINTASVTVGNFGSKNRFNYTAIGDGVNLASRLEGANKIFGTSILISRETNILLNPNTETRFIGALRVLGKNESVDIYEPRTSVNKLFFTEERLSLFSMALEEFNSGRIFESKLLFEKLPNDHIASKYLQRISKIEAGSQCDYDPVWDMTDK